MTRRSLKLSFTLLAPAIIVALIGAGSLTGPARADADKPARLFEMRTYTAAEGKLDALHARFRDHTNRLFKKHGIEIVGYWTPVDGAEAKNTLIYILAYPDRAGRDTSWKAFTDDPDWKRAHAESEKEGKLVAKVDSKFLTPTDYSPIR
jgi:hypothetical protein